MLRLDGPPAWHRHCAERRAGRALHGPGLVYGGYSVAAVKRKNGRRDKNNKNRHGQLQLAENKLQLSDLGKSAASAGERLYCLKELCVQLSRARTLFASLSFY